MKIDNKDKIEALEVLIKEIKNEAKTREARLKKAEARKTSLWIQYHDVLVELNFYGRFYHKENSNTNLAQSFGIRLAQTAKPYWFGTGKLPYAYHSEGDYIKINFTIKNNELWLSFYCTYDDPGLRNYKLIAIPLDLFNRETTEQLESFLNDFFEKRDKQRLEKESHNKEIEKQIEQLRLQKV